MAGRKPRETAGPDPLRPRRVSGAAAAEGPIGNNRPGSHAGHKLGPGNTASRGNRGNYSHGLASERSISDRAEAILTAMLSDARCPDYLRSPAFVPAMMAWSRAEAASSLAWEWCEQLGTPAMFLMGEGHGRSAVDQWKALHAHARQVRNDIGLSPVSYAKIARDLGIAQSATEDRLNAAAREGRAITARRMGITQAQDGASDAGAGQA